MCWFYFEGLTTFDEPWHVDRPTRWTLLRLVNYLTQVPETISPFLFAKSSWFQPYRVACGDKFSFKWLWSLFFFQQIASAIGYWGLLVLYEFYESVEFGHFLSNLPLLPCLPVVSPFMIAALGCCRLSRGLVFLDFCFGQDPARALWGFFFWGCCQARICRYSTVYYFLLLHGCKSNIWSSFLVT